ncbi:MAG: aromatic ring hydroxylase [Proteobacteria bacterium]|nr:aromatic ring hydroxylase [Pseudomonadota bacterium]
MTARTSKQYLAGLSDEREVWLNGRRVKVTEEPALQGSLRGMAGYYDWQHRHAEDCLVTDAVSGQPMSASLIIPRSREDLTARHRCYERLARYSYGMLGRTPDYCNTTLSGQAGRPDIWAKGEMRHHDNLKRFHREVIEGDLSLTHTIIHAAIDRSIPELAGMNADLTLRVTERRSDRIVVSGAKLLATLGPFADEIFVYPAAPIQKGEEKYALAFAVPVKTKGVIQVCRDHYGVDAAVRDRPFSSRFDEQDSFVIFDNVEVPNERVFVDGNIEVYNAIAPAVFPGNVLQQTAIRAAVKLEFAYDLCVQMARAQNNEKRPDVVMMLGEIYGYLQMTRMAIHSAETRAFDTGSGAFFPHPDLAIVKTFMPMWMLRVNDIIDTLGAHNLLVTPTLDTFDDARMRALLDRYMPGANGMSAQERTRIFRAAWDFSGSALGSRVELYERYYLGSRQRALAGDHFTAQAAEKWGQVHSFLKDSGAL